MFKKPINSKIKLRAFTLAEVLITLLIIGVVASIVIPSIINNTQDAELRTSFKKTYSLIDTTTRRIILDNGGTIKDVCPTIGWQQDAKCYMNLFVPYLSYIKLCISDGINQGCWHQQGTIRYLSGLPYTTPYTYYGMVLNDGAFLYYLYGKGDCSNSDRCFSMYIDVNGFKTPNQWGKDIFRIFIHENSIKFESDYDCRPGAGGETCAVKVLKGIDY